MDVRARAARIPFQVVDRESGVEIADYIRLVLRRTKVVTAIVVIAAVLVTLLFLVRSASYTATATVVVPTPTNSSSLIAAVSESISDFQAALSDRSRRRADRGGGGDLHR